MPENKFKRYRVDLKDDDAEYFDKMAEEMGVKPQNPFENDTFIRGKE